MTYALTFALLAVIGLNFHMFRQCRRVFDAVETVQVRAIEIAKRQNQISDIVTLQDESIGQLVDLFRTQEERIDALVECYDNIAEVIGNAE